MTKRILAAVLLALTLGACGTGHTSHGRLTLRYTTQEPVCSRSQLGQHATMTGDGKPFTVVCAMDGSVPVWGVPVGRTR